MTELKSCPFCGSDKLIIPDLFSHIVVSCDGCGTDGPAKKNEKDAIKAWNTRAESVCICTDQCGYDYCGNCGGKVE